MESCWTDIVTTPDVDEWSALLTRQRPFASGSSLAQLRDAARRRLTAAAQEYVLQLCEVAQSAGVAIPETPVLTGDPESLPIVMTGHQPVIFHGGLTFKYHCTLRAAGGNAIGVAVAIDVDEGDPGAFQYPQSDPEAELSGSRQLRLGSASFAESASLYGSVQLLPVDQLEERVRLITADLTLTTEPSVRKNFRQASNDYCLLAKAGVAAGEANSIVRWSRGIGNGLLELPLSAVCCFPEVVELTAGILDHSEAFSQAYNRSLQDYRHAHGIRNQANPFPDLQTGPDETELPFWVVHTDTHSRHPLLVRRVEGVSTLFSGGKVVGTLLSGDRGKVLNDLLLQKKMLIPRGALITAFLRLLFADLFVHGTGGGHYDQFTTTLIQSWWNVEPPPFVVASASQFLFAKRRSEIRSLQSLKINLRDLRFNPQRHFGTGVFTEAAESNLRRLYRQKNAAVIKLKSAHETGKSAKEIGHQIQTVSDEMKATVDHEFSEQLATLSELTSQTQEAVDCRTYPWFLFPDQSAS